MRTVNPKRLWRDVQETANPKERLERVKQAMARVSPELAALQQEARELDTARAQFANHPGKEAGAWHDARRLRLLAWLLLALDVPIQYLLNSAALPQVAAWKILVGSVALPLGIAGTVHYLGEPLLYDKDRPARSIRITKILAACSFLATAAGATVFLFARQAGETTAAYLVTLTAASLWTVAEALPITAGFVGAWAHMLARPAHEERRLNDVREAVATRERLLERLQQEEAALSEPVVVRRDSVRPLDRPVVRTTSLLFALVALFGSLAGAQAADSGAKLCALFVDRTVSVDSANRAEAVGLLSRSLLELVRSLDCRELLVGSFADEGAWAPRRWFEVPPRGADADCETTEPVRPQGTASLLVNIKGFQDHFRKEAVAECERARTAARGGRETDERAFLAGARAILAQPPLGRVTRTDLVGLIENLLEAQVDLILIVTDGIDTAHAGLPRLAVPRNSRVVLLLVPAREVDGGRTATRRAAAHWQAAGVVSVPYTVLVAPAGWTGLTASEEARP